MGFFKKSVPSELKSTGLTIIAKGNKISGDMVIAGKLHIDGSVEGSVVSIENVSISKTGEIRGKLKAKNVIVSGVLEGEVECEHLHIVAGGRVNGTVISVDLTMDPKSHFFGESREKVTSNKSTQNSQITFGQEGFDIKKKESSSDSLDDLPGKVTDINDENKDFTQKLKHEIDLNDLSFGTAVGVDNSSNESKIENISNEDVSLNEKNNTIVHNDQNGIEKKQDESLNQDETLVAAKILESNSTLSSNTQVENSMLDSSNKKVTEKVKRNRTGTKTVDKNTEVVELKL